VRVEEGVSPLIKNYFPFMLQGELKRGEAPLSKPNSPFPLKRGRGIKGDRVTRN
jgi:hypothetical protein